MLFPPSMRLKRQTDFDYSGYRSFFRIGAHISISPETKYLSLKETSSNARKKSIMALKTRKIGAPMFALDSLCFLLLFFASAFRSAEAIVDAATAAASALITCFFCFLRNYRFF